MKSIAFMIMLAVATACVSPTEPVGISQCIAVSDMMEGSWVRFQTSRGHAYRIVVNLSKEAPCVFDYRTVATLVDHDEVHEETAGTIVLTQVEEFSGVYSFQVDTKMLYRSNRQDDGTMKESLESFIYEQSLGKIWGDTMILWSRQLKILTE